MFSTLFQQPLKAASHAWREDEGALSFEWILLLTLLAIGIVSGLSTVRDALISELDDAAQATLALDQSYTIAAPLASSVHTADTSAGSNSSFSDAMRFLHCERATDVPPPPP